MSKWKKGVRRPCSVLWRYFTIYGHSTKYFKELFGVNCGLDHVKCIDHQTFLRIDEFNNLECFLSENISEDPYYFDTFYDVCMGKCENHLSVCKDISRHTQKWEELPTEIISSLFEKYHQSNLSAIPLRYGYFIVDKILQKRVEELLVPTIKQITKKTLQEIIYPRHLDFSTKELQSILKIVGKCQQNSKLKNTLLNKISLENLTQIISQYPEIYAQIKHHIKDFAWVGCVRYIGEPYRLEHILEMIRERLALDVEQELCYMQADRDTRILASDEFKKLSPNSYHNYLLDTFSRYAFLRNYRMDIFYIADHFVRPLLKEICHRLTLVWDNFICLTAEEIAFALSGKLQLQPNDISARKTYFDMYLENDSISVTTTPQNKKIQSDSNRLGKKINGQVANRGIVIGKACIVRSKHDNHKIKQGDIVISPMTTPDMNLALKKAAAIVTDEGGMLCHAAQYSREVAIPSIVGTEHATQIIEDGDMIEVNANDSNEGFVSILKI